MPKFVVMLALACLAGTPPFLAFAQVTAMPGRPALGQAKATLAVKSIVLPSNPIGIDLPPPSAGELYNASTTARENTVGFGRRPPPNEIKFDDTGSIAFRVTSPTARALRTQLILTSGAYRISAWADGDETATYTDAMVTTSQGMTWSPMTYGEVQNILVTRYAVAGDAYAAVGTVSHLQKPVGRDQSDSLTKDFGDAAPCQLDVVCLAPFVNATEALTIAAAANAVPLLVITSDQGATEFCSGTLLNTKSYPAPVLLTANHCVANAHDLSSLLTLWFYVRSNCGVGPANPSVQVTGGATLLWSNTNLDGALIQLSQTPPPLAGYAGWDASIPTAGEDIMALHHPQADALKGSFGILLGQNTVPVNFGTFILSPGNGLAAWWDVGFTEQGSSGSGLFTYDAALNSFVLRGTLSGGPPASCASSSNLTYYAQLNKQFPFISQYLSGSTPPPPPPPPSTGKVQVVEYFNASLNHYFITSNATEISLLGKPPFQAWQPTGLAFNAYAPTSAPTGSVGVCRFFNDHFLGVSTHFYAPHGLGCEQVLSGFPDWTLEDPNLFYAYLPDAAGNCPSGQIPVYRMFNNGMGGAPNHRFTTDAGVRAQMLAKGYSPEGAGIGVGWCAPQ